MLLLLPVKGYTQKQHNKYIQVSGIIHDEKDKPLSHVHVINKRKGNMTVTDEDGIYSLVARKNDTIFFSSIGYKLDRIIVPDDLQNNFFTADISMEPDTILLKTVRIFPWGSYEEFKQAFRDLDITSHQKKHANKNMSMIMKSIERQTSYTPSPGYGYKYTKYPEIEDNITRGTQPSVSLFNPIAWAQFFEALNNGLFSNDPDD